MEVNTCILDREVPSLYIHIDGAEHREFLPLIPLPIQDIDEISDVFIKLDSDGERWRSFLDITNCEKLEKIAEDYHTKILKERAYHARTYFELCLLISYTDSNWLSLNHLHAMKSIANLNLRCSEMEIISYQLTMGMMGISTSRTKEQALWQCAVILYTSMMWMLKKFSYPGTGTKDIMKESKKLQPFSVDSRKELASKIDKASCIIHVIARDGNIFIRDMEKEEEVKTVTEKLKQCILSLDNVLIVFPLEQEIAV